MLRVLYCTEGRDIGLLLFVMCLSVPCPTRHPPSLPIPTPFPQLHGKSCKASRLLYTPSNTHVSNRNSHSSQSRRTAHAPATIPVPAILLSVPGSVQTRNLSYCACHRQGLDLSHAAPPSYSKNAMMYKRFHRAVEAGCWAGSLTRHVQSEF